jgi:hypothetical protein
MYLMKRNIEDYTLSDPLNEKQSFFLATHKQNKDVKACKKIKAKNKSIIQNIIEKVKELCTISPPKVLLPDIYMET